MITVPVAKLDRLRPHILDKLHLFKTVKETRQWHDMIPDDATSLCSSWYVYFTNPNIELVFKLKYSDIL